MKDYDMRSVFEQMELELIASMNRNLSKHQKWEKDEGMNWTMWQAEQLKTLEQFKKSNKKIFTKRFTSVNSEIAKFLEDNYKTSGIDQEKAILERLAKGDILTSKLDKGLEGAFFSLNEKKMQAIINATTNDMKKAEHAMLRMANDQYRKTIFNAQTMANSGAFTLKQSIDRATKDFLKTGINCIEYKGGRRVNIATYAEMAVRTANKRAMLVSEGDARNALGIHTVRISKYGQCSETCLPFQGKVYVDDVYSGGTKEEAERLGLPLLSVAIAGGLFHPNCKHKSTTYFYDLKEELYNEDGDVENPINEQEHRKNNLRIQQQERLETGSLDPLNIAEATRNKLDWVNKDKLLYSDDEMLPFKFDESKIKQVQNSDEVVSKYLQVFDIKDQEFKNMISNELRIIPERALNILATNKIKVLESKIETSYDALKNTILINKSDYTPGILAHELGHAIVDINDLYKKEGLKKIMLDVLKDSEIKSKKYNGQSYITLKSDVFIRPYQGRTYIKTQDFIDNGLKLKYTHMEEYISVGYETFVTNPQLLYNKDKMLYDFFAKGGYL